LKTVGDLVITSGSLQSVAFVVVSLGSCFIVVSPITGVFIVRNGTVSLSAGIVTALAIFGDNNRLRISIKESSGVVALLFGGIVAYDESLVILGSVVILQLGALFGFHVDHSELAKVFINKVSEVGSVLLREHLNAGVVQTL